MSNHFYPIDDSVSTVLYLKILYQLTFTAKTEQNETDQVDNEGSDTGSVGRRQPGSTRPRLAAVFPRVDEDTNHNKYN